VAVGRRGERSEEEEEFKNAAGRSHSLRTYFRWRAGLNAPERFEYLTQKMCRARVWLDEGGVLFDAARRLAQSFMDEAAVRCDERFVRLRSEPGGRDLCSPSSLPALFAQSSNHSTTAAATITARTLGTRCGGGPPPPSPATSAAAEAVRGGGRRGSLPAIFGLGEERSWGWFPACEGSVDHIKAGTVWGRHNCCGFEVNERSSRAAQGFDHNVAGGDVDISGRALDRFRRMSDCAPVVGGGRMWRANSWTSERARCGGGVLEAAGAGRVSGETSLRYCRQDLWMIGAVRVSAAERREEGLEEARWRAAWTKTDHNRARAGRDIILAPSARLRTYAFGGEGTSVLGIGTTGDSESSEETEPVAEGKAASRTAENQKGGQKRRRAGADPCIQVERLTLGLCDEEVFLVQLHRRARLLSTSFHCAVLSALRAHAPGRGVAINHRGVIAGANPPHVRAMAFLPTSSSASTASLHLWPALSRSRRRPHPLAPPPSVLGEPRPPLRPPVPTLFDRVGYAGSLEEGHIGGEELICMFSDGPGTVEVHLGPIKSLSRMREKLAEYAPPNPGGVWPLTANILDPVRLSLVVRGPARVLELARWLSFRPSVPTPPTKRMPTPPAVPAASSPAGFAVSIDDASVDSTVVAADPADAAREALLSVFPTDPELRFRPTRSAPAPVLSAAGDSDDTWAVSKLEGSGRGERGSTMDARRDSGQCTNGDGLCDGIRAEDDARSGRHLEEEGESEAASQRLSHVWEGPEDDGGTVDTSGNAFGCRLLAAAVKAAEVESGVSVSHIRKDGGGRGRGGLVGSSGEGVAEGGMSSGRGRLNEQKDRLELLRAKNVFAMVKEEAPDGYRDLKLFLALVRRPGFGIIGEVQIHDAEFFDLKLQMHRLYTFRRAQSPESLWATD